MVANGCLLDEAFGEVKVYNKQKKKKIKKKKNVEIDRNFNDVSKNIEGFIPDEDNFFVIEGKEKEPEKKEENIIQKINHLKEDEYDEDSKNEEYRRMINDKDYQDYLNYQRNRSNYIHNVQTIESFSNMNDNFNDVLLFGLFGIFFLIFTDYIYKLGKKSY